MCLVTKITKTTKTVRIIITWFVDDFAFIQYITIQYGIHITHITRACMCVCVFASRWSFV